MLDMDKFIEMMGAKSMELSFSADGILKCKMAGMEKEGTYTVAGNAVTAMVDGSEMKMTIENDTLLLDMNDAPYFVFSKTRPA